MCLGGSPGTLIVTGWSLSKLSPSRLRQRRRRGAIPLSIRIAHVARDAAFQYLLAGHDFAVRVVRSRAGGAFDPNVAEAFTNRSREILARDPQASAWPEILDVEPAPQRLLDGGAIDEAIGAMGDFADLGSPFLLGHSAGVARLAEHAARRCHPKDVPDEDPAMDVREQAHDPLWWA